MNSGDFVSFKVFLIQPNEAEPEIRRFGLQASVVTCFNLFAGKLAEVFPRLSGRAFRLYWKDEEGDEVAVSSDEELIIALTCMKADVKKFFIKIESLTNGGHKEKMNGVLHPNIFCDGCNCQIAGFRYKCIMCSDYDLCDSCEKAGIHAEHIMIRIPKPYLFRYHKMQKMARLVESFILKDGHRDRKHAYEGCMDEGYPESHKKHKKCDRRESETGDESEEGCPKKHSHHSHKKMKKGKCPYSQVMSDVFTYLSPKHMHIKNLQESGKECKEGASEEFTHTKYLRTLGMTLQKFLDPLGVEVDFEVRPNGGKEERKEEEPAKETPPPSPSAPTQKEVRFADAQEVTKQKVDEISKLLAKQTMNGSSDSSSRSSDNDGWVQLEDLEKNCDDSQPSGSTGAIPKATQPQEEVSEKGNKQPGTSKAFEGQNLYPNLNSEQTSTDPLVRRALEQMLSMGFTNENNLLTVLLEAKKGNINQTLEMLLDQQKKN